MNKYLKQLIELSQIDKSIDGFGPRIEDIQKTLNIALEKERIIKNTIERYKEEEKDAKVKKSKNELHLAELAEKLKGLSKKAAIVKTAREVKALGLEEEIAKEQSDFANEEIQRLDKVIDSKNSIVEEESLKMEAISKEVAEIQESIAGDLTDIDKEKKSVYAKKEKLIGKMDQKILTFYEKIKKWAGNTTVVPVKKHACYGCFMKINDKIYNEVIKADEIVTCPHCGRILYKPKEQETKA